MDRQTRTIILSLLLQIFIRSSLSISFREAYFSVTEKHKFEGSTILKAGVASIFKCCSKCLTLPECSSLNLAVQPNEDGLYECVLLRNEVLNRPTELLKPSQHYHHYTRLMDRRGFQPEEVTCNGSVPLGMESRAIADEQISASSSHTGGWCCPSNRSRLNMQSDASNTLCGSWVAKVNDIHQWLQVDLDTKTKVQDIATQGAPINDEWVTSYSLQYSLDGNYFEDYEGGKIFSGNNDSDTVVKNALDPPIIARYIRVRPKTWTVHVSMRMELYGCRD